MLPWYIWINRLYIILYFWHIYLMVRRSTDIISGAAKIAHIAIWAWIMNIGGYIVEQRRHLKSSFFIKPWPDRRRGRSCRSRACRGRSNRRARRTAKSRLYHRRSNRWFPAIRLLTDLDDKKETQKCIWTTLHCRRRKIKEAPWDSSQTPHGAFREITVFPNPFTCYTLLIQIRAPHAMLQAESENYKQRWSCIATPLQENLIFK